MIEHPDAAPARFGVAFEGEVHFFDAVALGARAELCFGARSRAAEKDEIDLVHGLVLRALVLALAFARGFFTARAVSPLLARAAGACVCSGWEGASPAFNRAARSIIFASISPASPPFAGRFDFHTSG